MAYLYRKKKSPFWYVQFVDSDSRKHDKSTGLRADDPNDTAKAKALRAELEAREHHHAPVADGGTWESWVPDFLERHCKSEKTMERYQDGWKWIALWLQQSRLYSPRQITYKLAIRYVDWRTGFKKRTGKTVCRNTAIMELKLLAMLMNEAVRLGHADGNPLTKMDIQKDDPEEKPEMTDEEISRIREALKTEPEWMQISFDIALHTGCRLRETRIPLHCINFAEKKITFPSPKGGRKRAFSIPMPTALVPLFKGLKELERKYTLDFPFQPSRRWQQFFIKMKMEHLCFHCLRVSFITRLRRAHVPMEDAMRLVNHASELIHKIYQREKVEDVEQWRDVVQFPATTLEQESA